MYIFLFVKDFYILCKTFVLQTLYTIYTFIRNIMETFQNSFEKIFEKICVWYFSYKHKF